MAYQTTPLDQDSKRLSGCRKEWNLIYNYRDKCIDISASKKSKLLSELKTMRF